MFDPLSDGRQNVVRIHRNIRHRSHDSFIYRLFYFILIRSTSLMDSSPMFSMPLTTLAPNSQATSTSAMTSLAPDPADMERLMAIMQELLPEQPDIDPIPETTMSFPSASIAPPSQAIPISRGKPMPTELLPPKRKRLARMPNQVLQQRIKRARALAPIRDSKNGKFCRASATPPVQPAACSSVTTMTVETTPTPAPPPTEVTVTETVVQAPPPPAFAQVLLDPSEPLPSNAMFPHPSANDLATFMFDKYIIPYFTRTSKCPELLAFRQDIFRDFYHTQLVSYFQTNLSNSPQSFKDIDTLIVTALRLFGFY